MSNPYGSSPFGRFHPPPPVLRYGEVIKPKKRVWEPGEAVDEVIFVHREPLAQTVHTVFWLLFAEPEDLEALLWEGQVFWKFGQGQEVPISPLGHSTGSPAEMFFDAERSDMEKLAELGGGAPTKLMWRALAQTHKVGGVYCFRGQRVYRKHPVLLPADTQAELHVRMDRAFTAKHRIRLLVGVDGPYANTVEIG